MSDSTANKLQELEEYISKSYNTDTFAVQRKYAEELELKRKQEQEAGEWIAMIVGLVIVWLAIRVQKEMVNDPDRFRTKQLKWEARQARKEAKLNAKIEKRAGKVRQGKLAPRNGLPPEKVVSWAANRTPTFPREFEPDDVKNKDIMERWAAQKAAVDENKPPTSNKDIKVLTEEYKVESLDSTTYYLTKTGGTLEFDHAFRICHISFGTSMHNCEYRVHSKQFKDLSFVKGEKVKDLPDGISIRKYEDDTKFLYFHEDIPTFDSGDRDWDSDRVVVMYVDNDVTLIHCRFGYGIPRIEVYCGLKQSTERINDLLREIGCDEEKLPTGELRKE